MDELQKLVGQRHDIELSLSDEALEWLASEGFDVVYGARPLRRLIHRSVLNQLAARLLSGDIVAGRPVHVALRAGVELRAPGSKKGEEEDDDDQPLDALLLTQS
jgi:ATP-dependent Clp protease ATP-binding subunit ClpB|eukprot:COSAG01_NODE_2165_length_8256_cov_22.675003_5_plen_104_part_00